MYNLIQLFKRLWHFDLIKTIEFIIKFLLSEITKNKIESKINIIN